MYTFFEEQPAPPPTPQTPPEIPPKKIRRTINTAKSPSTSSPSLSSQPQIPLLPEELAIITVLKSSSQTTSSLIELTGLSPVKISIVLSQLELKDLIVNDAGTIKIKTW
jgi:predicted Rossmann fold nucleotide-binding protein DprA/Smf involved in DNA uptake